MYWKSSSWRTLPESFTNLALGVFFILLHNIVCKCVDFPLTPPFPGETRTPVLRKPEVKMLLMLGVVWWVKEILWFLSCLSSVITKVAYRNQQQGELSCAFSPLLVLLDSRGMMLGCRGHALNQRRDCHGATLGLVAFPILLTTSLGMLHDCKTHASWVSIYLDV